MATAKREQMLQEAEKLAARGKLDAAIKEYHRILDQSPHDTNTLNRLGDLLVKANRVDEAVEVYRKIAEHFSDDGFFLKAIAIYKKINRFDPQRTEIYERLADLYYKQGLAVEGRQQMLSLADWYLRSKQPEAAVRVYRRLGELEPANFQTRAKLVDVLIQQGDVDAVIAEIDDLGQALLDRNMMDEAVKLYHRALELGPGSGDFVARCLDALISTARVPQAVELADKALSSTRAGVELKRAAGQVFGAANRLDRAKELLEDILPEAGDQFEVVQAFSDVLLRSGDYERAREIVLPAVDRLIGARDSRRAAHLLKRMLRGATGDVEILERAARVFSRRDDPEMMTTIESALADAYVKVGRRAEAVPIYRRLSAEEPSNPAYVERLAELDLGAPAAGPALEARAADETGAGALEGPPASDEVAFVELELGEHGVPAAAAEAAEHETAVEELFTEATVFAKYGLVDKAIAHLQRLLEVEPSHTPAHELLASLEGEPGAVEVGPAAEAPGAASAGAVAEDEGAEDLAPEEAVAEETVAEDAVAEDAIAEEDIAEHEVVEEAAVETAGEEREEVVETIPDEILVEFPEVPAEGLVVEEGDIPTFEFPDQQPAADEPVSAAPIEAVADLSEIEHPPAPAPQTRAPRPTGAPIRLEDLEEALGISRRPRPPARPAHEGQVAEVRSTAGLDLQVAAAEPQVGWTEPEQLLTTPGGTEPGGEVVEEAPMVEAVEVLDEAADLVDLADVLGGPDDERLLEVDFFLEQGLLEEAGRSLAVIREEYPDHPEILSRQASLKARGWDETGPPRETDSAEALFSEEEQFFDLAAELERELADEELVAEATGVGQGSEVSIEDLFREFQRGVAEQVSEEDFDTHFNLGLAYREMGLFEEAIGEFQLAGKSETYFIECASMIGACYMDKGLPEQAAEWYDRALQASDLPPEAELGLRYELGRTQEAAGNTSAALSFYAEVLAINPGFRDVVERVSRLQQN